jgi:hypothetical protein
VNADVDASRLVEKPCVKYFSDVDGVAELAANMKQEVHASALHSVNADVDASRKWHHCCDCLARLVEEPSVKCSLAVAGFAELAAKVKQKVHPYALHSVNVDVDAWRIWRHLARLVAEPFVKYSLAVDGIVETKQ